MRMQRAYTLAELLVVIVMIGALAFVAVPRLQFGLAHRQRAEAAAWRITAALRRTRSLAILHAATQSEGFALKIETSGGKESYQIVNLGSSSIVDSKTLDSGIACAGGRTFKFTPLGALKSGSDESVNVSGTGRTFTISVVPATGLVRCVEN